MPLPPDFWYDPAPPPMSEEEIQQLKQKALEILEQRARKMALEGLPPFFEILSMPNDILDGKYDTPVTDILEAD